MSDNNQQERIDRRLRYFDNQFLLAKDFEDEQRYHLDRQRRLVRHMFEPGVVEGLEVTVRSSGQGPSTEDGKTVVIAPGTAIDAHGRQIVLAAAAELTVKNDSKPFVAIRFNEARADEAEAGTEAGSRWHERPELKLIGTGDFDNPKQPYVVLAWLEIVSGVVLTVDSGAARRVAGLRPRGPLSVGGPADFQGGLTVSKGGAELKQGLTVSGGLTSLDQGLTVGGALATLNKGLSVNGGLTTLSQGLTVNGAVATLSQGLTVNGTAATLNQGLTVNGAVATLNQGLTVRGNVGIGTEAPEAGVHIARLADGDAQAAVGIGAAYGEEKADLVLARRIYRPGLSGFGSAGPLLDLRVADGSDQWSVAQILGVSGQNYSGSLALLTPPGSTTDPSGARTKGSASLIRMVIREGGNVGIGTFYPGSRLAVTDGFAVGANYATNAAPPNGMIVEGRVGIGTNNPEAALHVQGALRLGQLFAAGGYENVRIIAGRLTGFGVQRSMVLSGPGYSITRVLKAGITTEYKPGVFQINFNEPFTSTPTVIVTQEWGDASAVDNVSTLDNCVIIATERTHCLVKCGGSGGVAEDRRFHFVVIGPR